MKISQLIAELQSHQKQFGDLEVTTTGCHAREVETEEERVGNLDAPFESTVETTLVLTNERFGEHVRLFWQRG